MDIELLNKERLGDWCRRLEMPPGATDALGRVAERVREDPQLFQLFAAFHEATALRNEWMREWAPLAFDPYVEQTLGQDASLFYLLAYLAALPYTEQKYRRMGMDLQIFHATMQDITVWLCNNSELSDHWRFENFAWIWRHLAGELFRLGRLQFMLKPYEWHATAFRCRQSGAVRLLCGPWIELRADGYAEGAGGKESGGPLWKAVFEETPEGWRGNLVAPPGFVLRQPVTLPRQDWELILKEGDTVLDIHIPRAQSLTVEECRNSLRRAFDFFARHFPERPFKAGFCHTWFFTPQLQQLLPPTSNIVRFQREFYLFPLPGGPGFLWSFVFGQRYPDAATAPRDTSLRRAVLDWLAEGKELFDLPGLMFHSPEEWGRQPYMSEWERLGEENFLKV